jgi:hypothetical protein
MDSSDFEDLMTKSGMIALPAVMVLLTLNYWGIFALSKIPIPFFVDGLYIYTIINGMAATPFMYLERRAKTSHGKKCPKCDTILEATTHFQCPKCGDLKFEK